MSSKHSLMPPLNAPLLLDFSKLKELSDGDAEFEKQILSLIIEQSKETVTEIHQSVTSKNYGQLKEAAHKYKSSIHILGNQELVLLFQRLEELSNAQYKTQDIDVVSTHAIKVCELLIGQLHHEVGS